MLSFEEYIENNYDIIRSEYEDMLIDQWYYWDLSEIDDWWREYQEKNYEIYLLSAINNDTTKNNYRNKLS